MTAALDLPGGRAQRWRVGDRVRCRYGAATIVALDVVVDDLDGTFIAVRPDRLADEFLLRAKDVAR